MGGTFIPAGAVGAAPIVATAALITLTAAGAYLYFHGIPAPLAETISTAGLGSTSAKGFAVGFGDVAAVLAILAASGFLLYKYSDTFREAVDNAAEKAGKLWGKVRTSISDTIANARSA